MADINVERRGPSIWPWIIGLIVLALLIWALVEMFGGETETIVTDPEPDTVTRVAPAPPPAAPVVPMDTARMAPPLSDTAAPAQPSTAPATPPATTPG